jgi:general nucleoside transport system permease protein
MLLNLRRNPRLDRVIDPLMPLFAVILALLIGAVMIALMGASPVDGYKALWRGAFGTKNTVADTLIKATPLLLVGLGTCIAFRGGVINIGGEGQMVVGGLAAVAIGLQYENSDPTVYIAVCLAASFLAGAVWGGIAGVLKAYFRVNEILSTIMLNQIATLWMMFLVRNQFIDPAKKNTAAPIPETARLSRRLDLPRIGHSLDQIYEWLGLSGYGKMEWSRTLLHNGIVIAVILAVVVYILLWRTTIGYRIRAVGKNPRASRYAGIDVRWHIVLSLMLSGGLAGLAGGVEMLGSRNHRMNVEAGGISFTGNAGFNGIVAALFGGLHPIGTIPASILFGALLVGGNKLQRDVQVPSALITALIGLVIVFVVSSDIFVRRRARRRVAVSASETALATETDAGP